MTDSPDAPAAAPTPVARSGRVENPLVSIVFNIALPAIVLYKLSDTSRLGPVWSLIVGLSLPLGYGLIDFLRNRKANLISILGFVSILLTGSFGLMHLDGIWFACKEATIPGLMAIAVVASMWTKTPLVKTILYNDKVIDVALVDRELTTRGNTVRFNRLLMITTWMLAASFLLSACLNFTLAFILLKSPAGSVEFNQELGKMTALSYPVIVLPCMLVTGLALWRLLSGIKALTGLDLDTIFKTPPEKDKTKAAKAQKES